MNAALAATYDRIAEAWDEAHADDVWWHPVVDRFVSFLPPAARVLDVGCGSGYAAARMTDAGYAVTGMDFSARQLEAARRRAPQARFIHGAIEELDALDERYDGVLAQAVLLHFPREAAGGIVNSIAGRLAEDGVLYISVKELRSDRPAEGMVRDELAGETFERFFSFFRMEELVDHARAAGLSILEASKNPAGRAVWLQIIARKC
jgi:2-polyprenyl-3-methyl-5-hydroxy-6-metoxy-1,4-benzoquinol methylase